MDTPIAGLVFALLLVLCAGGIALAFLARRMHRSSSEDAGKEKHKTMHQW
jgi:replication-associated recombination protein RarA